MNFITPIDSGRVCPPEPNSICARRVKRHDKSSAKHRLLADAPQPGALRRIPPRQALTEKEVNVLGASVPLSNQQVQPRRKVKTSALQQTNEPVRRQPGGIGLERTAGLTPKDANAKTWLSLGVNGGDMQIAGFSVECFQDPTYAQDYAAHPDAVALCKLPTGDFDLLPT